MILLVYALYFLVIPIAVCVLDFKCQRLFKGYRKALWAVGYALLSWGLVLAFILVPEHLGLYMIRGPELAFALAFGWFYLFISSIPVFFVYLIFNIILSQVKFKKGLESRPED